VERLHRVVSYIILLNAFQRLLAAHRMGSLRVLEVLYWFHCCNLSHEKISHFRLISLFGILWLPIVTKRRTGIREGGYVFLAHFERILVTAVIVSDCIVFFTIVVLGLKRKKERV